MNIVRGQESGVGSHVASCLAVAMLLLLVAVGCTSRTSSMTERVDSQSSVESLDDAAANEAVVVAKADPAAEQLANTTGAVQQAAATDVKPQPAMKASSKRISDITFDTIKFEMKKGDKFLRSMLTPEIEKLVDRRIRIRGWILPSFQQTGITQFVLVRDNMECCFGPGAALFDCIIVDMSPGNSANFTTRPVAVEGVFSINEVKYYPDDKERHLAIYHMVADKVR
jgi:hypothetical protein